MKICIDCKHYKPSQMVTKTGWSPWETQPQCARPIISLIDGKRSEMQMTCRDERYTVNNPFVCGAAGAFWEAKGDWASAPKGSFNDE